MAVLTNLREYLWKFVPVVFFTTIAYALMSGILSFFIIIDIFLSFIFLTSAIFWLIISTAVIGTVTQYFLQKESVAFKYNELKELASLPNTTVYLLIVTATTMVVSLILGYLPTFSLINVIFIFIFLQFIIKYFSLDCNEAYILNQIHKLRMDYASNMADMFFHGYLKIILPRTNNSTGIYHKMEQYEASQNVKIRRKKLFMLIPKSGHIPHNLETTDGWILGRRSLETLEIDRGGVIERPYKNSVYTIQDPDKFYDPIYVVLEGASPLKTLMEATDAATPWSHRLRYHRSQIIDQFYKALKMNVENDIECKQLIELVYYDDNVGQRNVGRLIYENYFME